MSALFTVIDQFKIPQVEGAEAAGGTLNRLQDWFNKNHKDPQKTEAIQALKVIRDARNLRNERQHSGMKTRAAAIDARRRLGLPDVTSDWGVPLC